MASSHLSNAAGGYNYNEKTYWTNRDFKTSSRLFMQHWFFQLQLGYVLHPSIPSKPDIKIADVACGNGAWLLEIRTPEPAQLHGYDISPNCFGAREWLPSNVRLVGGFDAMGELEEGLRGVYDVVHVRAFVSCVKNNEVKPFLETLKGMLKPGGCLQWEEPCPGKLEARVPEGSAISNTVSQGLVQFMKSAGERTGLLSDWMQDIPSLLQSSGFEVVKYEDIDWRPEFQKPWNDNLLTVYEELAVNLPLAKDAPSGFPMTREVYQQIFEGTARECAEGVWLYQPAWSVVARKV